MALILPGSPAFANCTDNLTGAPHALGQFGTNFTAGANNADGATVTVLTAVAHDIHYLVIGLAGNAVTGGDGQVLIDVLQDPAGGTAWASLIDDLISGFTLALSTNCPIGLWYHFPVYIKSGTSIGVRARTAHTSDITIGRVVMYGFGNPKRPEMWWCGSKVESLGINAAASKGTNVTPGNATYGAWTSVGSPTTGRYGAIQIGVNGTDAASIGIGHYWQIGHGSAKLGGSGTVATANNTNEAGPRNIAIPMWCDIPEGTQMQVRGACTDASIEVHNLALYGVF